MLQVIAKKTYQGIACKTCELELYDGEKILRKKKRVTRFLSGAKKNPFSLCLALKGIETHSKAALNLMYDLF